MVTCLVALCTVCTAGRKGRDINLITGVEHRLRTFFSLTAYSGSFIEELNLVRDFVIGQSPPPPNPPFLVFLFKGTKLGSFDSSLSKREARRFLEKSAFPHTEDCRSPLSAPPRTAVGYPIRSLIANSVHSTICDLIFTTYSCWKRC